MRTSLSFQTIAKSFGVGAPQTDAVQLQTAVVPTLDLRFLSDWKLVKLTGGSALAPGALAKFGTYVVEADGLYLITGARIGHQAAVVATHEVRLQVVDETAVRWYNESIILPAAVALEKFESQTFFLRKGWTVEIENRSAYNAGERLDHSLNIYRLTPLT